MNRALEHCGLHAPKACLQTATHVRAMQNPGVACRGNALVKGASGVLASHAHLKVGLGQKGFRIFRNFGAWDLLACEGDILLQSFHGDVCPGALGLLLPVQGRQMACKSLIMPCVSLHRRKTLVISPALVGNEVQHDSMRTSCASQIKVGQSRCHR